MAPGLSVIPVTPQLEMARALGCPPTLTYSGPLPEPSVLHGRDLTWLLSDPGKTGWFVHVGSRWLQDCIFGNHTPKIVFF